MFIFQTGRAPAASPSLNHCSNPELAMREWNSSVSGAASSTSALRTGESSQACRLASVSNRRIGDEIFLNAWYGWFEAVALEAGRLGLRGGDLALPGPVLRLPGQA